MSEARPCPLCGNLPQPASHFDAGHWEAVRKAAELRLAGVRDEVTEASRHIRKLASPPPPPPGQR